MQGVTLTNHILSTDVASELEVHTDDEMIDCEMRSRQIAAWAGRKLSSSQLHKIATMRRRGQASFDKFTEELFNSKCCVDDELLQTLLSQDSYLDRLSQFKDALWSNVASAMVTEAYQDQPARERVKLFLWALETSIPEDELDAELASSIPLTEEVAA